MPSVNVTSSSVTISPTPPGPSGSSTRKLPTLRFSELILWAGKDAARWEAAAAPVVDAARKVLGDAGTVDVDPVEAHLIIDWYAGPTWSEVATAIDDAVNKSHNYGNQEGNLDVLGWYGLSASFCRRVRAEAVGIAAVAATIGGGCPRCDYDCDEPWSMVFDMHLKRRDPHLLASHPNLEAVLDPAVLVRIAEVTAAMTDNSAFYSTGAQDRKELQSYICRAGHLPGLMRVDAALHRD